MVSKIFWVAATAVLQWLIVSSAFAQASVAPDRAPSGLMIEEVVVTVSKRSESLQDVLGSVSALSGQMLAEQNIQDFRTMAQFMPGVIVQGEEAGSEQVAIRGISRTRDGPSPVAFHVNDLFLDLRGEPYYDLQAVEVVRGPSGTAYGRNATAGAINAKWAKPEPELGMGGSYRQTDLSSKELRAYINVPLLGAGDDRLLARVAGFAREKDGNYDNLLTPDDADPGNLQDHFLRIYLTSEINDSLALGLRAIKYQYRTNGTNTVFSPSLKARQSGELEALGATPLPDDVRQVRSRAHERFGNFEEDFTRVSADITWSLEELPLLGNMDVVVVGGEMRRDWRSVFDLDGTEAAITDGVSEHPSDVRRTAELRFVSDNASGVDWLLGFFAYRKTDDWRQAIDVRSHLSPSTVGLPDWLDVISGPITAEVRIDGIHIVDDSRAVFLNTNLDLGELFDWPNIEVSAGIRHNRDEFTNETASSVNAIVTPLGNFPLVQEQDINQYAAFEETTGEVGVRWFYNESGMAYVKAARGYKPGLAQRIETLEEGVIQNPVDPEFLDSLEFGWKASFLGQSLQANMALYFYDYQNLQVSQITPGGIITENAAAASIQGFEMDLRWMPTASLSVMGGFAWTDASYDSYCGNDPAREQGSPAPGCDASDPFDFSGETLPASPEFAVSLLASYVVELNDWGRVTTSVQTSWTDQINRRGLGNDEDVVDAYTNSSVRLGWQNASRQIKVTAFVENLEDNSDLFFSAAPLFLGSDRPSQLVLIGNLPPRVSGIEVELSF
ncbi:TonB-dependent receptor [Zhongshania sp.]|uniref:TonB-dependent receptor n=1 Tax=Zhongshania sp. TaxID=1971902 RepID=UPI001B780287|nr:TonB-dependent receptor [Zhongshania sp.]MBQ0794957.1 TonB-dependent receptor [Zhongshania sp.]